jgi:anti-sigma B factor antagonist
VPLSLGVSREPLAAIVRLSGEIDISTISSVRLVVQELLETDIESIVLDLSDVRFMDSSGIGILVAAHRRAQARGTALTLRHPTPIVAKVLALTHVDQLVTVERAVSGDAALAG